MSYNQNGYYSEFSSASCSTHIHNQFVSCAETAQAHKEDWLYLAICLAMTVTVGLSTLSFYNPMISLWVFTAWLIAIPVFFIAKSLKLNQVRNRQLAELRNRNGD